MKSTFKQYLTETATDDPALAKLLDAVAASVPFIGYESIDAHKLADAVSHAFQEYTGMSWSDWKKRKQ